MKVILIGYRAAGKTTIGQLLAASLKVPFRDTDSLVEESLGMPVKEIVARRGWDFFRAREKETIRELPRLGDCVIATGGGVVLDPENVDLLRQMGLIVWLNTPLPDIIERLRDDARDKATRPQFTEGNIVQETAALLKQRLPLYKKAAAVVIECADKSALQIVDGIYQKLSQLSLPMPRKE
jgi:shikimate kinase